MGDHVGGAQFTAASELFRRLKFHNPSNGDDRLGRQMLDTAGNAVRATATPVDGAYPINRTTLRSAVPALHPYRAGVPAMGAI